MYGALPEHLGLEALIDRALPAPVGS